MANRRLFVAIRYNKSENGKYFVKSEIQICNPLNVVPDRLIFDTVPKNNGKLKFLIREYLIRNNGINVFFLWLSPIEGHPQWFIGKFQERQAKYSSLVIVHVSYCNNYLSIFYLYNYEYSKLSDRINYAKSLIPILTNLLA